MDSVLLNSVLLKTGYTAWPDWIKLLVRKIKVEIYKVNYSILFEISD